jgi:hypothetical protein
VGGWLPKRTRAWLALAIALGGCGGGQRASTLMPPPPAGEFAALPPDQRPFQAGRGPRFHPPATFTKVRRRSIVNGMRCTRRTATRVYAVHLELYAERLVFGVPAGIGVAPPLRRSGAFVLGGACTYPVWTVEPTGVVLVSARRRLTLGEFFDLWGQPLTRFRLAGFGGRVAAFIGGRRRPGDPRAIALAPHAEIVLEVGGFVLPHRRYLFPPITNLERR